MSVPQSIIELDDLNQAVRRSEEEDYVVNSEEDISGTDVTTESLDTEQITPPVTDQLSESKKSKVLNTHVQMMKLALKDAQDWCYGVKAIEVWLYNDEGKLERAEGGLYVDPVYFHNNDPHISAALRSLYDPKSLQFKKLKGDLYAPGEGLPGVLWSDTSGIVLSSQSSSINQGGKIHWRDVLALANDPDQPYNPRLKILACAGFRRAAAIPFHVRGAKGIVVFMTRESVDPGKLVERLNEEYMIIATEHIGSVQALFKSRFGVAEKRSSEARALFLKAKRRLSFLLSFCHEDDKTQLVVRNRTTEHHSCLQRLKLEMDYLKEEGTRFFLRWSIKMRGADIKPPPSTSYRASLFILFASYLSTLIMFAINKQVKDVFGEKYAQTMTFEPGQIASTMVAVYTLTASPAAQPRNIMIGRFISMLVGMTFAHTPGNDPRITDIDTYQDWVRRAGAVSFSAAIMAKLGVPFPPGGALSLLFLKFKWTNPETYIKIGIIILQDCILVIMVAILNNLSDTRTYPTYWGFLPNMISSYIRRLFKKKEKNENENEDGDAKL